MNEVAKTGSNASARRGPQGFVERIPDFLVFPATKSPLLICLGLALIATPTRWAIHNNLSPFMALIGLVIVTGLELSTYFRFVTETAYGKLDVAALEVTDIYDDLVGPLVRYLVACLPMVLAIAWFGHNQGSIFVGINAMTIDATVIFSDPGPAVIYSFGLLLLPLLTVVAAVSRSALAVINPRIWVQSLRILGATYLVAAAAFYIVLGFEIVFWQPLLLDLSYEDPIPLVTPVLTTMLSYLAMALRARILGGLCEPYFKDED
jgi:hypothetical protein